MLEKNSRSAAAAIDQCVLRVAGAAVRTLWPIKGGEHSIYLVCVDGGIGSVVLPAG